MLPCNVGLKYKKQAVVAVALVCWWCLTTADGSAFNDPGNEQEKNAANQEQMISDVPDDSLDFPVYLYFTDNTNQYLFAEERHGLESENPVAFCRRIVEALIQGPVSNLAPTLSAETEIKALFIDDKTVYVDLSREAGAAHPVGVQSELLAVYSIVNTLVLSVDGVDQVKILIEGQDMDTLAGHIDIRFPLTADMLIIR